MNGLLKGEDRKGFVFKKLNSELSRFESLIDLFYMIGVVPYCLGRLLMFSLMITLF
jgi:hypothetical protein